MLQMSLIRSVTVKKNRRPRARLVGELDVRLVDQCCRAQRVAGTLDPELAMGNASQLVVQEREQDFSRSVVAALGERR